MKVNQKLLDAFSNVLSIQERFSVEDIEFLQRFKRTPNAYKSEIIDLNTSKTVASGYVFDIREVNGKLKGRMGRLLVKESYRGLGLGSRVFDARVRYFGKYMELVLNAHPNRSSDLTKENFEERLNMLFTMYGKRGFIRIEGSKSGMKREAGELTYVSNSY